MEVRAALILCACFAASCCAAQPPATTASQPPAETTQPPAKAAPEAPTESVQAIAKPPSLGSSRPPRSLDYWADQLANQRYLRRQTAERRLIEGGRRSIPVLLSKLEDSELEMVQRIIYVLAKIAGDEDPGDDDGAYASLKKIAEGGIGSKAALAESTVEDFNSERDYEARQRLTSAGVFIGTDDVALGSRKLPRQLVRLGTGFNGDKEALRWLRWLRNINFVMIEGEASTPEVYSAVITVPSLDTLLIVDADISLDSLAQIGQRQRLGAMEFRYVRLNQAKLDALSKVNLRNSLYLVGTGVTDQQVERFKLSQPGLDVTRRRGGFLGVICHSTNAPYCQVDEVRIGSGADQAGLRAGDLIIEIDGAKITRFEDLQDQIDQHIPGDEIKIRYQRFGQTLEGTATLGKLDDL